MYVTKSTFIVFSIKISKALKKSIMWQREAETAVVLDVEMYGRKHGDTKPAQCWLWRNPQCPADQCFL